MISRCVVLLFALVLAACGREPVETAMTADAATPPTPSVRFATFNTSLYSTDEGGLIARLEAGDDNARRIAAVIQRVRPDVILLNEFDYDPLLRAADLFQRRYLEIGQHGQKPIRYDHRYSAPVNTGVPSGLDLDRDGQATVPNDTWGFGHHPGQYGMLVLSRYPIDATVARTFQRFLWKDLPEARRPLDPASGEPYYEDAAWAQLRLSSKSHWDLPVETPLGVVHLLASHPTPPVFDGPENRNGLRNSDEIRFWAEYLWPDPRPWLCDDTGRCGGLAANERFVIAGDLNADPADGEGEPGAIAQLLTHPRVNAVFVPRSAGAERRAREYGLPRAGDPSAHTADFGPAAGTLRVDYVLPSQGLSVRESGVFWPTPDQDDDGLAGASDHHAAWIDVVAE